ncbi:hypothetical protein B0181_11625 [Moraxella caviae]|uniref:Major capsid protein n=1 Tax=Moraxella caviae TaxID=34060 RepID=A0A1S9ZUL9_9GAMM|nr:major capsid protein [Moraxella caviae]OOR86641.1 hypothetical protein B0181_11625 [Moraxella caviae]STZ14512.1 Uncharacterised protein [Moraxella caviae]VEW11308.1 Uncharacterised protein [Moraxella caviae]
MFDLEKFNKQTYTVMTETIDQEVQVFNAQSGGTIELVAKPFQGDFDINASFKLIAGLVRHRDVNNGTNAINQKRLEQIKDVGVKIAAGTDEIVWESAQYRWIMQNPELAAVKIGEQLAKGQIANMLNSGIKSAVSAIRGNTDVTLDKGEQALDYALLTQAGALFGDRSNAIKAWILHSGALTKLQLKALANSERLFTYDSVAVFRDPFGRVFVVTDSPDLVDTNKFNVLGLTEGGVVIANQNDFDGITTHATGKENIQRTYQAEWSYGVSVKGYAWDIAAGGANPNAATLATPTNWKKTATSNKDTAGVLLITQ